jgi:beta-ureidopropionase / N-carbamoyl-L-amino-acid hydrolase
MEPILSFEQMWRDLAPVGRSSSSGGYFRQPYESAETELRAWFVEQADARGLRVESDDLGNIAAWWSPEGIVRHEDAPEAPGSRHFRSGLSKKGVLTGSHLDSVLDGGAFDGPLGVVAALAAIDLLRERGFVPTKPLGVSVFAEEEGSRFGLACLGSRLATGGMEWTAARELRDRDGVFLPDALGAAGLAPDDGDKSWDLHERVECFVELHVEQGRDLVDRGAAIGVGSEIGPHGRYRFDFTGQANHAGTTRMEDRRDPMLTYAMTALAANKQARLAGERATFGRVEVFPNGTNAVPSRVTAWLDARCTTDEGLAALVTTIEKQGAERAGRDGTTLAVTAESVSGSVAFDPSLARQIAADHEGGDWPIIPTMAGHDAGILSAAGIPTAMLFVRNPTGVSHSPDEHAELADCLVGVTALADTLERLSS